MAQIIEHGLSTCVLYLESLDLFEHVDGSAEAPNGTGENVAALQRAFKFRSKKAWTYICLAVEPE